MNWDELLIELQLKGVKVRVTLNKDEPFVIECEDEVVAGYVAKLIASKGLTIIGPDGEKTVVYPKVRIIDGE